MKHSVHNTSKLHALVTCTFLEIFIRETGSVIIEPFAGLLHENVILPDIIPSQYTIGESTGSYAVGSQIELVVGSVVVRLEVGSTVVVERVGSKLGPIEGLVVGYNV